MSSLKIGVVVGAFCVGVFSFPAFADERNEWSGIYVGAHVGTGWGSVDERRSPNIADAGFAGEIDANGFVGGGFIGTNWQWDKFVLGLEGDFSWTDLDGQVLQGTTSFITYETNWFATVRARAGVAIDRMLFFATAGLAWASLELGEKDIHPLFGLTNTIDSVANGYVVGGGVEFLLSQGVSARVEALHYEFEEKSYDLGHSSLDRATLDSTTLRGGVSIFLN